MRICSVPGCNNKHHAKGYCQKHYQQSRSHRYAIPDNRDRRTTHNVFRPVNTISQPIRSDTNDILDHCLMELKDMLERIDKLN